MSRPLIRKMRLALLGAVSAALVLPVSAAQSQSRNQIISASERAEGAKAHPQLLEEFGGPVSGPQFGYVETVGKNIAVHSGLSNARGDFTVTLLNSSIDNAFAIPGGYVYVTRQLVSLMNNEAELAAVLGHEVAHVAARHSAKRQSAATRNSIIGAIGSILSGVLLGNSQIGQLGQQLFGQGTQMLTLQFSRGQETEADNLGINYLRAAGYDPRAMSTVLYSLAQQNALDARLLGRNQNTVPEWASTHPDPAGRVRAALSRAGTNATGVTNRDTFLSRIEGLVYGDDPKQGVIEGRRFTHPEFRLAFEAPSGFYLVNGTRSVSVSGQSGKGEFSTRAFNGDLQSYVTGVFSDLSQSSQARIVPSQLQRTTINGIPAAIGQARVNSGNGTVDVTVVGYHMNNDRAFHFMTITQAGQSRVFSPMFNSVRRISAAEAGQVRPRRLDVVTVGPRDTQQTLAARMAYSDDPLGRFRVLNGLNANTPLTAGQKVKIVTY
jgi:predicted Zn-dependent protease